MSATANEAGEVPVALPDISSAAVPETSSATATAEKSTEPVVVKSKEESKPKDLVSVEAKEPVESAAPPTESSSGPTWPELEDDHPLAKLLAKLPELLKTSEHDEVYGVTLKTKTDSGKPDFHTLLILQKFLRANQNDLDKAVDQLLKTLEWRKEFNPIKAVNETFSKDKFAGLGYVTESSAEEKLTKQIVTWNIYGAVKDYEKTFVPLEE
jgi:phosphatidylinositol transfer protein SFH5